MQTWITETEAVLLAKTWETYPAIAEDTTSLSQADVPRILFYAGPFPLTVIPVLGKERRLVLVIYQRTTFDYWTKQVKKIPPDPKAAPAKLVVVERPAGATVGVCEDTLTNEVIPTDLSVPGTIRLQVTDNPAWLPITLV